MRRLIVPSSLLALAALLCVAALLSPAGAAGAQPPTLCPQQGAQTCSPLPTSGPQNAAARPDFVPCCPTPTNGTCCTSTTCCTATCCTACTPTGLTIAA